MTAQIIEGQTMERSVKKMSSRFQNLHDKVAVVTGASSGIGKSIALALAEEGARVCFVGRKQNTLEEVAKLVREHAPKSWAFRADLTRDEDIAGLAADLGRDGGHVDILILCGGEIHHAEHAGALITDFDAQYR